MRKTIIGFFSLLLFLSYSCSAQLRPAFVSFGGGLFDPGAQQKFFWGFKSGMHAEGAVFFPFYRKVKFFRPGRMPGLEFTVAFDRMGGGSPHSSMEDYRYNNGGSQPERVSWNKITKGENRALHFLIGPSFIFNHGNFYFAPSLKIGFSSVQFQGLHYYDTIRSRTDPTLNKPVTLYYIPIRSAKYFSAGSSVKAGMNVTRNISLEASVQYILGPRVGFWDIGFNPEGVKPSSGVYEFSQMVNGGHWTSDGLHRWKGTAFQARLRFRLGRKNPTGVRHVTNGSPLVAMRSFYLVSPEYKMDIDLGELASEKAVGEHVYKQRDLRDLVTDTNVILVKPHYISTVTADPVVAEQLKRDSMSIKFQLYKLENGKNLAIPFPGYFPVPTGRDLIGCGVRNCGGLSGVCRTINAIQFCSSVIKEDVPLSGIGKITNMTMVDVSNGVAGQFLQITYDTEVFGKKVRVIIEGKVDSECQTCWIGR